MTRKPNVKSGDGFSVKARDEYEKKMIQDLKKLSVQDDVELSELIFEGIIAVFKAHHWPPGNPQRTLEDSLKPKVKGTCQVCGLPTFHKGLKNGVWLGYCDLHWDKKGFEAWR